MSFCIMSMTQAATVHVIAQNNTMPILLVSSYNEMSERILFFHIRIRGGWSLAVACAIWNRDVCQEHRIQLQCVKASVFSLRHPRHQHLPYINTLERLNRLSLKTTCWQIDDLLYWNRVIIRPLEMRYPSPISSLLNANETHANARLWRYHCHRILPVNINTTFRQEWFASRPTEAYKRWESKHWVEMLFEPSLCLRIWTQKRVSIIHLINIQLIWSSRYILK